MYIYCGISFRSEKDAYSKVVAMMKKLRINVKSTRLDRYYSGEGTTRALENTQCYLIPKKNATLKNSGYEWKKMLELFEDTKSYLFEYFKRNQSESCFSEDKRRFDRGIRQKRLDRINRAIFTKMI